MFILTVLQHLISQLWHTPQYLTSLVSDGYNLCLLVEIWWKPLMVVFLEAPAHPSSATVATDTINCCDLSSAQLLLRVQGLDGWTHTCRGPAASCDICLRTARNYNFIVRRCYGLTY